MWTIRLVALYTKYASRREACFWCLSAYNEVDSFDLPEPLQEPTSRPLPRSSVDSCGPAARQSILPEGLESIELGCCIDRKAFEPFAAALCRNTNVSHTALTTLLEVLVGDIQGARLARSSRLSTTGIFAQTMQNPWVVSLLGHLLPNVSPLDARRVLGDVFTLVSQNCSNRNLLLSTVDWTSLLRPLQTASEAGSTSFHTGNAKLQIALASTIMTHTVLHGSDISGLRPRIEALMRHYEAAMSKTLCRMVLLSCLKHIATNKEYRRDLDPFYCSFHESNKWKHVAKFLKLCSEWICFGSMGSNSAHLQLTSTQTPTYPADIVLTHEALRLLNSLFQAGWKDRANNGALGLPRESFGPLRRLESLHSFYTHLHEYLDAIYNYTNLYGHQSPAFRSRTLALAKLIGKRRSSIGTKEKRFAEQLLEFAYTTESRRRLEFESRDQLPMISDTATTLQHEASVGVLHKVHRLPLHISIDTELELNRSFLRSRGLRGLFSS